jgi:hypothetical protein
MLLGCTFSFYLTLAIIDPLCPLTPVVLGTPIELTVSGYNDSVAHSSVYATVNGHEYVHHSLTQMHHENKTNYTTSHFTPNIACIIFINFWFRFRNCTWTTAPLGHHGGASHKMV